LQAWRKASGDAVTYLILKAVLSGVLAMIVSEIARRSPGIGGLVASLPLISLMAIIWLWRDTADIERVASHAEATFWYVLPTLPMFLVLPAMLRGGVGFWIALAAGCLLTISLYAAMLWVLPRVGINF
jgi:F0F1-type ATP synthase assembly protein I